MVKNRKLIDSNNYLHFYYYHKSVILLIREKLYCDYCILFYRIFIGGYKVKKLKICVMILFFVSLVTIVQAQQSAFQGTWIEEDLSDYRLEISGTKWSFFIDDVIEAAGTAKFSTGGAVLSLANGKTYFDFTLLAPGLMYHVSIGRELYSFRLVQANSQNNSANVNEQLTIWSYTDELANMVNNPVWGFRATHPGVKINYSQTPSDQFQAKLDPTLAAGRGTPDIITLESSFVRKYVESGLLLDITDIYEANKSKLLAFPVEVGTYNGKVYALSWQACSGAMYYRRSLARKYLGTDDPRTVQTYFANFNKFLDTAKLLKDKSNGSCVVVSSLGDLMNPFLSARKSPWIVNNKLVIDPAMEQYMDICKTLHDNRLEGRVGQWSEGWFDGMKGDLRYEYGKTLEVFSYFLPTWGLHYVLKTNAPSTSGDWAMIQGPSPYRWGGT
jgi:ABC-type glycerol-3-phosphate transport system substrate-binding protein